MNDILRQILDDPLGVLKFEDQILEEWVTRGSGDHMFAVDEEEATLADLCRHGADEAACPAPAALMYEFIEEMRLQEEFNVLVAADGVNYWDKHCPGISTPRYPVVYGFQMHMVDIFSQFQRVDAMPRVISVMSTTSHVQSGRQNPTLQPNHVIAIPSLFEPAEFDAQMWSFQAMGLSSQKIARDDYLKIEGASGRMPRYVTRTAVLY